jgi:tripartite-type tricarboxylate transporter receptor subunit TctC
MKRIASLVAAAAFAATAADFPSKPIHIIVPNPPGGTVDIVARSAAQGMGQIGQPVMVEPKPGGNNVIGSEAVARAAPDGHTILLGGTHTTINPLMRKLPYDGLNAFQAVALLAATPNVIAVNAVSPVRSLEELIAAAKSQPGKLNLATSSPGNGIHLTSERFQSLAGIRTNYIPFQGGVQAALAVAAGHADIFVGPLSDAAPHVASGKLRLLAVTSAQRSELVKDVPTLAESGFPGFQALQWFGVFAPAGTPKAVVDRLSAEMRRAIDRDEVRANFAKLGISVMTLGPAEFDEFLRSETRMFAAVIRENNIKAE